MGGGSSGREGGVGGVVGGRSGGVVIGRKEVLGSSGREV